MEELLPADAGGMTPADFRLRLGPKGDELTADPDADPASDEPVGQGSAALRAFAAAARREPHDPDYAFVHARALLMSNRPAEAVEACRSALLLGRSQPEYHFTLGCALWKLGRAEEAASAFSDVAHLQPDDPEAHTALGAALTRAGHRLEAAAAFAAALDLDPRLAEAHGGLGVLAWQDGRRTEALQRFRRAATLRPESHDLLANLGLALLASGRPAAALSALRRAVQLAPGDARAQLDLAQAAFTAGGMEEASLALAQASRLDPTAITRSPPSLAVRDALQAERIRAQLPPRPRTSFGALLARTALACVDLLPGRRAARRLRAGFVTCGVLLALAGIARLAPPYFRHFLLRDDVVAVARAPVEDDALVRDRLAHAIEARRMRTVLDPDSCSLITRPAWRRITCSYQVPVSVVPGVTHTLSFRIDTEQPYLAHE